MAVLQRSFVVALSHGNLMGHFEPLKVKKALLSLLSLKNKKVVVYIICR